MIARQAAAFEACLVLIVRGDLDEHFRPTYVKKVHALRNARQALQSKKQDQYAMQSKPSAWSQGQGTLPETYYCTIISLQDEWDRPVRPFALFTRHRIPHLPEFPIHRLMGEQVNVSCVSSYGAVVLSEDQVGYLTGFTLAVFKDIYNKKFENAPEKMSYWVAPLLINDHKAAKDIHYVPTSIDWTVAESAASSLPMDCTPDMDQALLHDKFLIDPFDGGRRLFTQGFATHLRPTDPVPDGVAGGYKTDSIIEYSVKLWKKARGKASWNTAQPVLEAVKIMHRLNVLSSPCEADQDVVTKCFVIAEPFKVSRVSMETVYRVLSQPLMLSASTGRGQRWLDLPRHHSPHRIVPHRHRVQPRTRSSGPTGPRVGSCHQRLRQH